MLLNCSPYIKQGAPVIIMMLFEQECPGVVHHYRYKLQNICQLMEQI